MTPHIPYICASAAGQVNGRAIDTNHGPTFQGDSPGIISPKVILQLSDLHMSTNAEHHWASFGDRQGDFRLFVNTLLPYIRPSVVVITGDLTDSKDKSGAGRQDREEWEMYKSLLNILSEVGIDEYHVLDVRGNHDMFNVDSVRSEMNKELTTTFAHNFTAFGQRGAGDKRTFAHVLFSSGRLLEINENQNGSIVAGAEIIKSKSDPKITKTWVDTIRSFIAGSSSESSQSAQPHAAQWQAPPTDYPIAAFLGIDFSIDPGLKNPFNFFGQLDAPLRESISASTAALTQALETFNASETHGASGIVPIIAYGHFPLSTVDSKSSTMEYHGGGWDPKRFFQSTVGAVTHLVRGSIDPMHPQNPIAALSQAPVTTYISGHLHTAFGERMHKAHVVDSMVTAKATMSELETGAWKDDRRFRLIVVDRGVLSFVDYYFVTWNTPKRPRRSDFDMQQQNEEWKILFKQRGWGITATNLTQGVDEAAVVLDHFVIVTYPPDLRFAPQQAFRTFTLPGNDTMLTAVVIPTTAHRTMSASNVDDLQVRATGYLDAGGRASKVQLFELQLSSMAVQNKSLVDSDGIQPTDNMAVFTMADNASIMVDINVVGERMSGNELVAWVQVAVSADTGTSFSPLVPIALTCSRCARNASQTASQHENSLRDAYSAFIECKLALPHHFRNSSGPSVPVSAKWLESTMLSINWPVYLHRLYIILWSVFVAVLLLVPFLFNQTIQSQRLHERWREMLIHSLSCKSSLISGIKFPIVALLYTATVKRVWIPLVSAWVCILARIHTPSSRVGQPLRT